MRLHKVQVPILNGIILPNESKLNDATGASILVDMLRIYSYLIYPLMQMSRKKLPD